MRELLDNLLRLSDEDDFDYIVVVISSCTPHTLDMKMLQEGRWVQSKKNGWCLRIDPPNPQLSQQRHVHIARSKHINAKNMQVAWNVDGTRHDRVTFNQSIQAMQTAARIARDALGLGDDVVLESAKLGEERGYLKESATRLPQRAPVPPVWLVLTEHSR
jgi:hypothetical protein